MILLFASALAADFDPVALAGPAYSTGDPSAVTAGWMDPAVRPLIDEALTSNHDLAAVREAAEVARQAAAGARSVLLPGASLDGAWSTSNTASLTAQGFQTQGLPDTYQSASLSLGATWLVDVFGGARLSWRASRWDAEAARGDLQAAELSVASGVAGAWYDLLAAREQEAIAERRVAASDELLELVELRYERGDASALELLQQRQEAASTRTSLPSAQLAVRASETVVAVLVGRSPTDPVPSAASLPDLGGAPSVGAPADLVDARPDLRAAQADLEAAEARQRAASRAFAPTIAASAFTGQTGRYFDDWSTTESWTVGASASLPLFSGGANLAGFQAARAATSASEHAMASAFLSAVQDVEIALASEAQTRATASAAATQLQAAQLAFDEARRQYADGLTSYLTVLSTHQALRGAELTDLSARRDVLSARISLLDALGAGLTE